MEVLVLYLQMLCMAFNVWHVYEHLIIMFFDSSQSWFSDANGSQMQSWHSRLMDFKLCSYSFIVYVRLSSSTVPSMCQIFLLVDNSYCHFSRFYGFSRRVFQTLFFRRFSLGSSRQECLHISDVHVGLQFRFSDSQSFL